MNNWVVDEKTFENVEIILKSQINFFRGKNIARKKEREENQNLMMHSSRPTRSIRQFTKMRKKNLKAPSKNNHHTATHPKGFPPSNLMITMIIRTRKKDHPNTQHLHSTAKILIRRKAINIMRRSTQMSITTKIRNMRKNLSMKVPMEKIRNMRKRRSVGANMEPRNTRKGNTNPVTTKRKRKLHTTKRKSRRNRANPILKITRTTKSMLSYSRKVMLPTKSTQCTKMYIKSRSITTC